MCSNCSMDSDCSTIFKYQEIIDMIENALGQSTNINNINSYKRELIKSLSDHAYAYAVKKLTNENVFISDTNGCLERIRKNLLESINKIVEADSGAAAGIAYANGTLDIIGNFL